MRHLVLRWKNPAKLCGGQAVLGRNLVSHEYRLLNLDRVVCRNMQRLVCCRSLFAKRNKKPDFFFFSCPVLYLKFGKCSFWVLLQRRKERQLVFFFSNARPIVFCLPPLYGRRRRTLIKHNSRWGARFHTVDDKRC